MPATTNFLPTRESELVTWSNTFKALITATPTAYGLTAGQATAFGTLHNAFITLYNAANADATRTPSGIIAKNEARDLMIANARLLAGIIQKFPGTTNTMRSDLGLTVKDSSPTPIPPPASAPQVIIESAVGNTMTIRMIDPENPTRRGKPDGVAGAAVFSFVGENPPTSESVWKFEGNTTRTQTNVLFPSTVAPGAKIWFTAFWFNPRSKSGPASPPISSHLPGGAAMAA